METATTQLRYRMYTLMNMQTCLTSFQDCCFFFSPRVDHSTLLPPFQTPYDILLSQLQMNRYRGGHPPQK